MSPDEAAERRAASRVSLWKVERLMRGELSPEEAASVRAEVESMPVGRQFLERYENLHPSFPIQRILTPRRSAPSAREWFARFAGPRVIFPAVVALAALVGASFWFKHVPGDPYSWKGGDAPAFRIRVGNDEIGPDSSANARSGDTLTLIYRSPENLFCRVLYQEDGADMEVLPSQNIPASTSWRTASRRVLLEGSWDKQKIWIVWSRREIEASTARSAIQAGSDITGTGGWSVFMLQMSPEGP